MAEGSCGRNSFLFFINLIFTLIMVMTVRQLMMLAQREGGVFMVSTFD